MQEEPAILILGSHGAPMSSLADRIRQLGFRAIRAKTPRDALDLAQERGFRFPVGLIDSELPAPDLAQALSDLRRHSNSPDLVFLATGHPPDAAERRRLAQAGVEIALWHPVMDNALLFHLNRAVSHDPAVSLRGEQRVPTDWTTRAFVTGREKRVSVYSLSAGGAFLATRRPSQRGCALAIDLPLPSGVVSVLGEVVYTNVPGNLHRRCLPDGMGVRFLRTSATDRDAIGESVLETAARYLV